VDPSPSTDAYLSSNKENNMSSKLWFVTDGANLLSVFDDRHDAERELEKYEDDPDFDYFDHYGISVDELEDYPDEYDFAQENGFIR